MQIRNIHYKLLVIGLVAIITVAGTLYYYKVCSDFVKDSSKKQNKSDKNSISKNKNSCISPTTSETTNKSHLIENGYFRIAITNTPKCSGIEDPNNLPNKNIEKTTISSRGICIQKNNEINEDNESMERYVNIEWK